MTAPILLAITLFACPLGSELSEQASPSVTEIAAPAETTESAETAATTADATADQFGEADLEAFVVVARKHSAADPLEGMNLKTFAVAQAADAVVIRPAAMTYAKIVPEPVRMGVRNFFRNLHEPVVFLNFLLQLKPRSALRTLGRFAVNTTVGGAGLFDMAKKKTFNLPYRPNGFANTLAYYGVKPGAFLYLPLIGPTTVRDLAGLGLDTMTMPTAGLQPIKGTTYAASSMAAKTVDARSERDDVLQAQTRDNPNAYATIREAYLAGREAEIAELRGQPRLAERDAPSGSGNVIALQP